MLAQAIDYVSPVPGAKQVIEQQAAQARDPGTKASLLETAASPLVFPSSRGLDRTYYHRTPPPSEADIWNRTFNAVILG